MGVLLVGNDQIVTLDGLVDVSDGNYANDATVELTLKDTQGTEVTGQSWPLTMDYIAASNGKYQGTLEDTAAIVAGRTYVVEISASKGPLVGFWRSEIKAAWRKI